MGIREVSLPIFAGILQGKQYVLSSRGKLVRVLMGTYEQELTHLLVKSLDDGGVFWDIGAHAGYYSMVAAQLVGRTGEIVAFEPSPRNVHYLNCNMERNRIETVRVVPKAVDGAVNMRTFNDSGGSGRGSLVETGDGIQVEAITIDHFLEENPESRLPDVIKIDVEGAEVGLLHGAGKLFERKRPVLFLSLHGPEITETCRAWLNDHDYAFKHLEGPDAFYCVPEGGTLHTS